MDDKLQGVKNVLGCLMSSEAKSIILHSCFIHMNDDLIKCTIEVSNNLPKERDSAQFKVERVIASFR